MSHRAGSRWSDTSSSDGRCRQTSSTTVTALYVHLFARPSEFGVPSCRREDSRSVLLGTRRTSMTLAIVTIIPHHMYSTSTFREHRRNFAVIYTRRKTRIMGYVEVSKNWRYIKPFPLSIQYQRMTTCPHSRQNRFAAAKTRCA